jgi:hypothetical protein
MCVKNGHKTVLRMIDFGPAAIPLLQIAFSVQMVAFLSLQHTPDTPDNKPPRQVAILIFCLRVAERRVYLMGRFESLFIIPPSDHGSIA